MSPRHQMQRLFLSPKTWGALLRAWLVSPLVRLSLTRVHQQPTQCSAHARLTLGPCSAVEGEAGAGREAAHGQAPGTGPAGAQAGGGGTGSEAPGLSQGLQPGWFQASTQTPWWETSPQDAGMVSGRGSCCGEDWVSGALTGSRTAGARPGAWRVLDFMEGPAASLERENRVHT